MGPPGTAVSVLGLCAVTCVQGREVTLGAPRPWQGTARFSGVPRGGTSCGAADGALAQRLHKSWASGGSPSPTRRLSCSAEGVVPGVAPALATGEHLMGNIFPFCDVKCQNITGWARCAPELSVAVNSGAGEALPGAWGMALP